MSIVEFALDKKRATLTSGYEISRGTEIESEPVDEEPCVYQTCFDTRIWPIRVSDAHAAGPPFSTARHSAHGYGNGFGNHT